MALEHVGIKVLMPVKEKWIAEAEEQGRSLSDYIYCRMERPELIVSPTPHFPKPIREATAKRLSKVR